MRPSSRPGRSDGADRATDRPGITDARLQAELRAWLDDAPHPRAEARDEIRARVARTRQRPRFLAWQAAIDDRSMPAVRIALAAVTAVVVVAVISVRPPVPPTPGATPGPSVLTGRVGDHPMVWAGGFDGVFALAPDGSSAWLASADGRIVEVDAASLETVRILTLPDELCGAPTLVEGAVWVATCDGHLARIDRAAGTVTRFPGAGQQLGFDGTAIWALDALESSLEARDPATGAIERSIRLEGQSDRVLAGLGVVWVLRPGDGRIVRVDPVSGDTRSLAVGDRTYAGAVGTDRLWAADLTDGRIVGLSAAGEIVEEAIVPGTAPSAIAEAGGLVWVLVDDGLLVLRADDLELVETIALDVRPTWIAAAGSDLWLVDLAGRLTRVDARP